MAIKTTWSLTTLAGTNEQASANPITVTTSGTSREYPEIGQFSTGLLFADVSAASGTTPSLTLTLEVQDPISLKWSAAQAFAAQTAATGGTPLTPIAVTLNGLNYRLRWAVSGTTPSFTFTCALIAATDESF